MEYKAIYRCRLCGTRYPCTGTTCKDIAYKTVVELTAMGYSVEPLAPTMTAPHICQGERGVGVADFLGWELAGQPLHDDKQESGLIEED